MRPLEQVQLIQNAMALAGTSQAEIARGLGKSQGLVSLVVRDNLEKNGVQPSPETVAAIKEAINTAVGRDVFAEADSQADVQS